MWTKNTHTHNTLEWMTKNIQNCMEPGANSFISVVKSKIVARAENNITGIHQRNNIPKESGMTRLKCSARGGTRGASGEKLRREILIWITRSPIYQLVNAPFISNRLEKHRWHFGTSGWCVCVCIHVRRCFFFFFSSKSYYLECFSFRFSFLSSFCFFLCKHIRSNAVPMDRW